jgi:peptidyl-prolyl cis-trans isomerase SurA
MERLINETIQLERAKLTGIRISDEKLNEVIGNIAKENKLSVTDFRIAIEKQGIPFNQFRLQIANEYVISRLKVKQVDETINVSQKEIEDFLHKSSNVNSNNEYLLSHILIAIPEAASPEIIDDAKKRANDLYQQIIGGKDFKQLAIAYSDGQQALKGGDLGWRKTDYLPTLFLDVAVKMKAGDISHPLRSSSGFHLLKLEAVRGDKSRMIRQVNARHILIVTNKKTSDGEAKKKLSILRQRIINGEDFAELAQAFSDDPGSAVKGGELGWSDPEIYVPAFKKKLSELKKDEISRPFKSAFGWHVIQLLGWREQDQTAKVKRNEAFTALRQQKIDEARQNWIRRIRDEAYIEIR